MSSRDIARSSGVGRTTVYDYLARAKATEITSPLEAGMYAERLEARRLFSAPTAELSRRRPMPNWREVHRKLKAKSA